jgi:hypothetical protein
MASTFLTSGELAEIQARLERFLELPEGHLTARDLDSYTQPRPYIPQNSTALLADVQVIPPAKDQIALDLWRLLRVAEMVYSDG